MGRRARPTRSPLSPAADHAYTWAHIGTLPHGISFNTKTGVLSGTPTQSGSFSIEFKLTDSSMPHETAARTLTLVIAS